MALSTVSEWAQAFATLIAAISTLLAFLALQDTRKSLDARTYLEVLAQFQDAELKLQAARHSDDEWHKLLALHLNLIEGYCYLVNHRAFMRNTENLVVDQIINHLSVLTANEAAYPTVKLMITNENVFEDILRFYQKHKPILEKRAQSIKESMRSEQS